MSVYVCDKIKVEKKIRFLYVIVDRGWTCIAAELFFPYCRINNLAYFWPKEQITSYQEKMYKVIKYNNGKKSSTIIS